MSVLVDTSGLLAVLDADDSNHQRGRPTWEALISSCEPLHTSNYVLLELIAVAQRRLGLDAIRALHTDVLPLLTVHWVIEEEHRAAAASLLLVGRRDLSLVDCVSFDLMRRCGLSRAFTFDSHFARQGFECLPGGA